METIIMNNFLDRNEYIKKIKSFLINFENNKDNLLTKRGIYIYGASGVGKTTFVKNILKEMDYDIIIYNASDIRNKSVIDTITQHNMSDKNIMSLFYKKIKKIAIIMDEIDGMNSGDKGGINSLIKIIRPKKTKKQKTEELTLNPIICIGNYHIDKKIKELMKVCLTIELPSPTNVQIKSIITHIMPNIENIIINELIIFIQNDLRKLSMFYNLYNINNNNLNYNLIKNILLLKNYNQDTKLITKNLINKYISIEDHLIFMNETDRTIVGLLWHENIIDILNKYPKKESIPFYINILNNICFADNIDRTTFQKQIWQLNEMSSLIKTFKNNNIYHNTFKKKYKFEPSEIRFTKVLTKYSTEYNNSLFIQKLCYQLSMDKKDLFCYFMNLRKNYNENEIVNLLDNYEITKLDINRMYRYLDKYIKDNNIEEQNNSDLDDE
jgi:SpoVK/Ycf46/Vps4 family AAA+-type ATPase